MVTLNNIYLDLYSVLNNQLLVCQLDETFTIHTKSAEPSCLASSIIPTTINSREGFKFNNCTRMVYYHGLLNLEVNSTQQTGVKNFHIQMHTLRVIVIE